MQNTNQLADQNQAQQQQTSTARYPNAHRPGSSDYLRKRLEKGRTYFDSGDYNVAKAKEKPTSANQNFNHLQSIPGSPYVEYLDKPKPVLSPDEIRTSKNSPPPKLSKLVEASK